MQDGLFSASLWRAQRSCCGAGLCRDAHLHGWHGRFDPFTPHLCRAQMSANGMITIGLRAHLLLRRGADQYMHCSVTLSDGDFLASVSLATQCGSCVRTMPSSLTLYPLCSLSLASLLALCCGLHCVAAGSDRVAVAGERLPSASGAYEITFEREEITFYEIISMKTAWQGVSNPTCMKTA